MSKIKRILDVLPYLVLWLLISLLVWGLFFSLLTDTDAENKLTVYSSVPLRGENELANEIEERFSGRIRMAKVKPFTYFMFGGDDLEKGDVFIVREGETDDYADWFDGEGTEITLSGGVFLNRFLEFPSGETYFLFAGKNSKHIGDGFRDELKQMLLEADE